MRRSLCSLATGLAVLIACDLGIAARASGHAAAARGVVHGAAHHGPKKQSATARRVAAKKAGAERAVAAKTAAAKKAAAKTAAAKTAAAEKKSAGASAAHSPTVLVARPGAAKARTPAPASTPSSSAAPTAAPAAAAMPATPLASIGTDLSTPAAADGDVGSSSPTATLRWAPPTLVNPTVIKLGTGATHTSLSTARDYIIQLPGQTKVGGTWLDGGRNVVVKGGKITIPEGTTPGSENDWQRTGIHISNAVGTVHVEGVQIDGSGGADFDGIDINAPKATVQLENLRIVGVRGRFDGLHADVVQTWGGVKALRIDMLTATSNYQGLQIDPDIGTMGSADVSRVDLSATTDPTTLGGHLIWLTTGSNTCTTYVVVLSQVYLTPRAGLTLDHAVWPDATASVPCRPASMTGAASAVDWPALPTVSGGITGGAPPHGSFVPEGAAGIGYASPGYAS